MGALLVVTCRLLEETNKNKKKNKKKTPRNPYISPLCGAAPLWGSDPKFVPCVVLDDVIKYPKAHFDISNGFYAMMV